MNTHGYNVKRIAVIGGGASGLFAAIFAAKQAKSTDPGTEVVVYEAKDRVGKKLLVTGNGRCNLTNREISADRYFGAKDLFRAVYPQFDSAQTLRFFDELGVHTSSDAAGRVYPASNKAASVVDALLYACDKYGVIIRTNTPVTGIQRQNGVFIINGNDTAGCLILSGGGMIDPSGKRSNGVFPILKSFGVRLTAMRPALTGIEIRDFTKSLKGVRAAGALALFNDGKACARAEGEIQYAEYGLSGIPAMQLSSYAARMQNEPVTVVVDSAPSLQYEELKLRMRTCKERSPDMPVQLFLTGLMPKPLGIYLLKEAGIAPGDLLGGISKTSAEHLLREIKAKTYTVKGLRGFENAQVTSGGVDGSEIGDDLMLKRIPDVYVCGETVDIDGDCGGYNLQWAWSSGAVAGMNAVRESI